MTKGKAPGPKEGAKSEAIVEHLIVLRAQLGDPAAFGLLFDRHHDRVLEHVRRLLRSRADAEDVLQDVWVRVVRGIAKLEDPAAFRAWLYRIAHNEAVSRLRWRRRRVLDVEDLGATEIFAIVPEPSGEGEDLPGGFEPEAVGRAMLELSDLHREVLTLRYFEDFTYEEISRILGRSPGTVRSRIHYAKKALEHELRSQVGRPMDNESPPADEEEIDG